MKQFLPILGFTAIMASCGSQPKPIGMESLPGTPVVVLKDTAGLADYKAFQEWKRNNDLAAYHEANAAAYAAGVEKKTVAHYPVRQASSRSNESSTVSQRSSTADYPGSDNNTGVAEPQAQPEKKGWSKAAKGAAIGAGSGAVIGAVVNKRNRAVGAAIGGAVGAGVGYGIGRSMDKKDGRY